MFEITNSEFESRGVEIVPAEGLNEGDILVKSSAIDGVIALEKINSIEGARHNTIELDVAGVWFTVEGDTLFIRVRNV